MSDTSRMTYEIAGAAFLVAVGAVAIVLAALLSPVLPSFSAPWAFVAIVAGVLGWRTVVERLQPGALPGTEAGSAGEEGDGGDEDGGQGDGGVLDVELVNWANALVGTDCLRCEDEITYVPLGVTDGRSKHRIECGCTIIESTAKD